MPLDLSGLDALAKSFLTKPKAMSRIGRAPVYFYNDPKSGYGGFQGYGRILVNQSGDPNLLIRHEDTHAVLDPELKELAKYNYPNYQKVENGLKMYGGYGNDIKPENVVSEGVAYGAASPTGAIPNMTPEESKQFVNDVLARVKDPKIANNLRRLTGANPNREVGPQDLTSQVRSLISSLFSK